MEYTEEQLKKTTEETLGDIAGCCDAWNFLRDCDDWDFIRNGYKANGICPDCGRATFNGECICGCCYSPVECKTCGAAPCDGSC